jgi:hypothetical protein
MAAIGLASCSSPVSYVVLTLQSAAPTPITGVTSVDVDVTKGSTLMKSLTYPHEPALMIDQVTATTLSVSFTESQVGAVDFKVTARTDAGCAVGTGTASAVIVKGARADVTVALAALTGCPSSDGGTGDAGGRFPGCNPVDPMSCSGGATCEVDCDTSMGVCTMGGSGPPGSVCQKNSDCMPGTQCFDYSKTGCGVKVCLRFCDTVAQCAQPGDGGVGPGSLCAGPVVCNGVVTGYHTCTFSCDPTLAAISAGASACPTNLSCLVVGNMDQVDCACPEATRTGREGASCTGSSSCAPGYICNLMGGTETCRPVCRCNAQGMTCTATNNDCPTAGTSCRPLTNDTMYGVCL